MLMLSYKIAVLLIPIVSFAFGIFSIYKNKNSKTVWLWFLTSMSIGVWGLGLFMSIIAKSVSDALMADKVLHVGSTLIPAFFFHFVSVFLYREKKDKILIVIGYVISGLFFIVSLFTSFLVGSISPQQGFEFWVNESSGYIPFFMYFLIYMITAIGFLIRAHRENDGARKAQIFYIMIAMMIGFFGGITDILPQFNIFPYGNFVVFIYPMLMTYGLFLKD